MKDRLLISACFLGRPCKYDGGHNALPPETLDRLRERWELVPVCPETAGDLPIPREPSERLDGRVVSRSGEDVTAAFEAGARIALTLARRFGCRAALLKERSPSCGAGALYDGTFSHSVIPGDGVTAEALRAEGLSLCGESGAETLF